MELLVHSKQVHVRKLTHVSRTIVADEGQCVTNQAHKESEAITVPPGAVLEVREDGTGRVVVTQVDHGYENSEEAKGMKNQDHAFDLGQESSSDSVDEDDNTQSGPHDKGTVPSVIGVGGVIENKKALNHAAAKKYTCGCVCVSRVAEDKKAWISDPCLLTSRLWQSNLLSSSGILCASRGRAWRPSDIDPPK